MNGASCGMLNAFLDTMNFGVFILDDERKPLFANVTALRLTGEGQAFQIDGQGVLRAAHGPADRRLIESIDALRLDRNKGQIRPISVDADEHRSGIFAWVSQLVFSPAPSPSPAASHVTSLMVTEKVQKQIGRDVLADLFNLTPAESRLLTGLVHGLSPNQYAAQKNLSQNTVRNQLKSIFEKTEVRRQSDLVGMVSAVLAPVLA